MSATFNALIFPYDGFERRKPLDDSPNTADSRRFRSGPKPDAGRPRNPRRGSAETRRGLARRAVSLLPQHERLIRDSAISAEVAAERGYWSAGAPKDLLRLFGPTQRELVPALVIPTFDARGEHVFCQLRPDSPRVIDGKARKYELPHKARMAIDVPPRVRLKLGDPKVPLVITEGARKADAAVTAGLYAIDLVGVWTWRGRNEDDGLTALADFEHVALNDGRVIYLAFDSDAMTKHGVHAALVRLRRLLKQRGAEVRVVYLPNGEGGAKMGLDDFLAGGHTRDDVLALASDQLPELGSKPQRHTAPSADAPLRPTAELLAEVAGLLDRFVILPSRAAALTVALYVLHTWAFDAAHATPYLAIGSATKRSGKTRLEELLELLVRAAWRITAASEAAMFRKIDAERPTLLLDEVDALFGSRTEGTEPIRAILNAGNRPGAAVARMVGEGASMLPVDFSVYCPKVLAGINTSRWPDTIVDRSIVISLRRKKPSETVERLRLRKLHVETEQLRAQLARWAGEHASALRDADPRLPDNLDDRAAEAWEPLLAIAELADSEQSDGWTERAHRAAVKLAGERAEDDAHAVVALHAIKDLFDDTDALSTESITAALNDDERLPFGDYRKGVGLNGRKLAELLRPFEIRPRTVRTATGTPKGYRREQFADAWERYCTTHTRRPLSESRSATPPQPNIHGGFGHIADPPHNGDVADSETATNLDEYWDVADVAARKGETGLCLLAEVSDAELLAVFPGSTIEQLTDSADSDSSLATVEDLATPEQEAFLARLRAYYPELA